MIQVVKRKLHSTRENHWRGVTAEKRLEAVEIISGIWKGKDAEQPFSRVHRVTRKNNKAASPRPKDKIDLEELKRIREET